MHAPCAQTLKRLGQKKKEKKRGHCCTEWETDKVSEEVRRRVFMAFLNAVFMAFLNAVFIAFLNAVSFS